MVFFILSMNLLSLIRWEHSVSGAWPVWQFVRSVKMVKSRRKNSWEVILSFHASFTAEWLKHVKITTKASTVFLSYKKSTDTESILFFSINQKRSGVKTKDAGSDMWCIHHEMYFSKVKFTIMCTFLLCYFSPLSTPSSGSKMLSLHWNMFLLSSVSLSGSER